MERELWNTRLIHFFKVPLTFPLFSTFGTSLSLTCKVESNYTLSLSLPHVFLHLFIFLSFHSLLIFVQFIYFIVNLVKKWLQA